MHLTVAWTPESERAPLPIGSGRFRIGIHSGMVLAGHLGKSGEDPAGMSEETPLSQGNDAWRF